MVHISIPFVCGRGGAVFRESSQHIHQPTYEPTRLNQRMECDRVMQFMDCYMLHTGWMLGMHEGHSHETFLGPLERHCWDYHQINNTISRHHVCVFYTG